MKRLNPAMRENFRYILVKIEPYDLCSLSMWIRDDTTPSQYDAKELYYTLFASITDWYGDRTASQIGIAVPAILGPFAILRMRRGTEHDVFAILPCIREHLHAEIRLAALKTSGTIRTLKEEIMRKRTYLRTQEPLLIQKTNAEMEHLIPDIREKIYDTDPPSSFSMWLHPSGAVDIEASHDNLDKKENGFNRIHLHYLTKDDF
ncbi:MAG: Rpp14/Pop5 family protein [Methanomicrobiales archaeon]|jgi:RNase P/RNase MRP subunit POP5|nr:Rpp14/Pop5 family protein [Methanomicrobiales archaeon]